jgi:hypothetical protein
VGQDNNRSSGFVVAMRYGKFLTNQTENVDDVVCTASGETYTDSVLRSLGFYPIETVGDTGAANAEIKYTLISDENGGHIEERFTVHPVYRTFSKYKLKLEIAKAGLLSPFMQLLESVEVAPGYSGADAFNDALTLDEDNEKFKDAVRFAKSELGLTDEDVERILSASVSELG